MCSYLDEADVLALLPETLAAEVETVFANETGGVCADATVQEVSGGHSFSLTAGSKQQSEGSLCQSFSRAAGAVR